MMLVPEIATHLMVPGVTLPENLQIYNGLDCMITVEVLEALHSTYGGENAEPMIYGFERALQAPLLEMQLRGFRVDEYERQKALAVIGQAEYSKRTGALIHAEGDLGRLAEILQEYAHAIWDRPLNPRSTVQLREFFYSHLHLPEQWISQKGVRKLAMNREVLEKLEVFFHATPIVAAILSTRDLAKQREILVTEVDPDGRWRTSYNIGGTDTGRLSSSSSAWGTGSNTQNINPRLRRIFVSDPGWKLCGIDLAQTEARDVGWLCGTLLGDWTYLDALEGGDLHTMTSKLIWRDLKWPGNPKGDRQLADTLFYRDFTYRDMAKRGGHGSTYMGTPWTMSRHLKVPVSLMEDFQKGFFSAYPSIQKWHRWVAQELETKQWLTNLYGRGRHFFARPNDDTTLRAAVAFAPQSSTADRMNLGMWRVWKHMAGRVELLAQVHDAIYFQYPEDADEDEIISEALSLVEVPLIHDNGDRRRTMVVPGEAKIGWNWGAHHDAGRPISPRNQYNPNGLKKWTRGKPDTRQRLCGTAKPM